jgi:leucyl/phenylalanyl-tRNA--protein transferase
VTSDFDLLIQRLVAEIPFPSPAKATGDGLIAYGGDLQPERLIAAYAQGIFPWYDEPPILWFSPDPRMVLEPHEVVVNRTLAKNLRRARYAVRLDTNFEAVIRSCATAERPEQDGTWINDDMLAAYCRLHELGVAHSAEAYAENGELVGGIYGISLGGAFFGESMYASRSDASKVAFVTLVRQLERWGFDFLDCQLHNAHLDRLGAREWPRERFLRELAAALRKPTRRGKWELDSTLEPGGAVCREPFE